MMGDIVRTLPLLDSDVILQTIRASQSKLPTSLIATSKRSGQLSLFVGREVYQSSQWSGIIGLIVTKKGDIIAFRKSIEDPNQAYVIKITVSDRRISYKHIKDVELISSPGLISRLGIPPALLLSSIDRKPQGNSTDQAIVAKKSVSQLTTMGRSAQNAEGKKPGGIDFNAKHLNLNENGEKVNFDFGTAGFENLQPDSINGLQPIIINITPLPSIYPLLGLNQPASTEKFESAKL